MEDVDVKGEEDDDVDVTEENDNVEEDDVEEEDRSQDLEAHFARACAGETPVNISQEPVFTDMFMKCRAP